MRNLARIADPKNLFCTIFPHISFLPASKRKFLILFQPLRTCRIHGLVAYFSVEFTHGEEIVLLDTAPVTNEDDAAWTHWQQAVMMLKV
jgi:hypothetical protein